MKNLFTFALLILGAQATTTFDAKDVYHTCEVMGVLVATWGWILHRNREGLLLFTGRLQVWWTGVLYGGMLKIFSMKVDLEGDEFLRKGPMLVFPRHVSTGDTIIPSGLILRPHNIFLRYVMKSELLWDVWRRWRNQVSTACAKGRGRGAGSSPIRV